MVPPIFELLSADTQVTGLLGVNPTRVYPFGEAPQKGPRPYVVWQLVGGTPENYLETDPDIDLYSIQIDVYSLDAETTRAVAKVLRDAIQRQAHVTSYNGEFRDAVTRDYRYSFGVDWYANR